MVWGEDSDLVGTYTSILDELVGQRERRCTASVVNG